ncbi:UDP binding domain-containing protein [Streptomyces albidoflavus]|uniref:UDP binding domain-containing protein n=1 Tax=Streptomyces albidoflavus TaxID=1886 RepID=UPI00268D1BF8
MARAGELGADQAPDFLREVDSINTCHRERMVSLAREQLNGVINGTRITVWGAAFKPDTDDIRDSPALAVAVAVAVAQALHQADATVTVFDPKALDNAREAHPRLDYADHPFKAAEGAELLLHLTEWPEFTRIDPADLATRVAVPRVIDGRGALKPRPLAGRRVDLPRPGPPLSTLRWRFPSGSAMPRNSPANALMSQPRNGGARSPRWSRITMRGSRPGTRRPPARRLPLEQAGRDRTLGDALREGGSW